ncbi:MAG TPA: DNA-directed RNA polymerase subunit alpha [Leptospiraceae bacterium]|nr:DNA-directed RNA polymerase subunit alpha [Leptospirales bacterium]HMU83085.1 DNA-directed RNA polymerase subunit alpha [Leptospiraceae bacterium]HMW59907.1 DNA-directed RNA polymerase subunit alpha [Leptospiraceae bacterium]HMX57429.1 DNA-directed RNA polymerase subunit alpha [Leptospiraceae bacterium]HMY44775.1 DNA-directed RNA polymerase subunit alpha [Leptospiraceae bacterium]
MNLKHLMKGLKRPRQVEFGHETTQPNYGRFVAEPFERGFGATVGNSLRRTLMSSIEGTAITAVRIEGVAHEFSTIEGVVEDVTRIILNLKQLRATYDSEGRDEPKIIHIEKRGAGQLTAADFAVDSSIQILNPELHVATLNEDANLIMDVQFERGRGYVPSEILKKNIDEIGTIAVDALFSPVRRANLDVSETRVGQRTDYEKITLDIWTDGSIAPEDALAQAAKILKEHLTVFINFQEEPEEELDETNELEENLRRNLEKHVEELELSVRSLSVLKSLEIETLADLVRRNEEELQKSRHYSPNCVEEIRQKLAGLNLEFGMRDFFAPRD